MVAANRVSCCRVSPRRLNCRDGQLVVQIITTGASQLTDNNNYVIALRRLIHLTKRDSTNCFLPSTKRFAATNETPSIWNSIFARPAPSCSRPVGFTSRLVTGAPSSIVLLAGDTLIGTCVKMLPTFSGSLPSNLLPIQGTTH